MRHARDLPVHMPCATAHDNQGVDISAPGYATDLGMVELSKKRPQGSFLL
jgi:hypothetical protein